MTQNKAKDLAVKLLTNANAAKHTAQKMITRKEVADYLKVSVQTVINYTNRGLLTSYKIGRRVLYNEAEVIASLQSCAVKRYQHELPRIYIV